MAEGATRIYNDYFSANPVYGEREFRRRYRMSRRLFNRIASDLSSHDTYFTRRRDAKWQLGTSTQQKMTAALRVMAYAISPDAFDENVRMGESTIRQAVKKFARGVVELYGEEYLRKPTQADLQRLCRENAARGFPGMWGSLDRSHVNWNMCPYAWKGQYQDKGGNVSIILEAIASHDTWIWHFFFGMPGS